METNILYIILGFIEGFGLIISPCILPIIPVFLALSLNGSRSRLVGMVAGFTLLFGILIFFSRQLVAYLDLTLIRILGYLIMSTLGIIMLSSYLSEKFSQFAQTLNRSRLFFSSQNTAQGGFLRGVFLGGLIVIIWTPCAGPILAAIIVQTVVQKTTAFSLLILFSFALGAVLPLFILTLYGKKLIKTFNFFKTHTILFRKLLGAAILFSVVYIVYLEERIIPSSVTSTGIKTSTALVGGLWNSYPAPPIEGISDWINSPPLRLSDLKGKVVLIDFWTYSCINCLRTLPYLNDWYRKYHDKGLIIIGVHSPEFSFEKNLDNVTQAVKRNGILYPVALDNQFATWINFQNHYWPAHYLINKQGKVVYQHFGEGDYDVTENNIRFLLGINELTDLNQSQNNLSFSTQTPETYLGYERANPALSPVLIKNKPFLYHYSAPLSANAWSLSGLWQVNADSITALKTSAGLKINFKARKVFMVMGNSTGKPIKMNVFLNGRAQKDIMVKQYSIYEVATQATSSSGYLECLVTEPGVKIYTMTFGD